jgi:replicative DNA helicase
VAYANPRASAYEGMTQVSKDVKTMARRLAVPTIAVAQLSRDVEKGDRKPRMSDLRDSGSLEQDADSIWLLHRPDRTSSHAAAELVVAKNRNGKCGDVELYFDAERTLFRSVEWKAASA